MSLAVTLPGLVRRPIPEKTAEECDMTLNNHETPDLMPPLCWDAIYAETLTFVPSYPLLRLARHPNPGDSHFLMDLSLTDALNINPSYIPLR